MPIASQRGLPTWNAGTASIANGSRVVTFVGSNLVTTDPSNNNVSIYAAQPGDVFAVSNVALGFIESVDSATQVTLVAPWSGATQSGAAYAIYRFSPSMSGQLALLTQQLIAQGGDSAPDVSRTIDDSTARVKLRLSGGKAQVAVGPTGTADGSLKTGIEIDPATGVVSHPNGVLAGVTGFRNRVINGNFDVWQRGTSFSVANGSLQYTADRTIAVNNNLGVALSVTKATSPSGFRGQNALRMSATGVVAGSILDIHKRLESRDLVDLDGVASTVSFDLNASVTAGALTGSILVYTNSSTDDGTFATLTGGVPFTVPSGSGVVSATLPASAMTGVKKGAVFVIRLTTSAACNLDVYEGSLQLEKGTVANPFEFRPLPIEMAMCKRYYNLVGATLRTYVSSTGTLYECTVNFPDMRATPTSSLFAAGTRSNVSGGVAFTPVSTSSARFGFGPIGATGDTYILGDVWALSAEL